MKTLILHQEMTDHQTTIKEATHLEVSVDEEVLDAILAQVTTTARVQIEKKVAGEAAAEARMVAKTVEEIAVAHFRTGE